MSNQELECKDITKEIRERFAKGVCCGIYGLRNKTTGKWYIGLSKNIEKRWQTAYQRRSCRNQRKLFNALMKYGYEDFEKYILEECSVESIGMREEFWIEKYDSIKNGYNLKKGGILPSHFFSHKIPKTYRPKQVTVNGKKVLSEEHKANISDVNTFVDYPHKVKLKGHFALSDDTKSRMATSHKGKIHSDETKKKIRESALLREQIKRELRLKKLI